MISKKFKTAAIGVLISGSFIAGGCTNTRPPQELLAQTEAEIEKARYLGAQQHAPVELLDAEDKLARAKEAIEEKQYEAAETMLEQAMVDAEYAAIKSRSTQARSAAGAVSEDIEVLRKELELEYGEYSGETGEGAETTEH